MSLFERIKNKRYDLQEKKKFPGDESGAYKQAKDDLEARKGFSKNKSGGLKADEKNPFVKRSVRKTRVDKLGGDIYDQPKFSQKKFEKTLKKSSKGPRTGIVDPFGPGDTPGQQKVKAMDKRAFKVTQAKDVKQTTGYQTYEKLSKGIKDLKKSNKKAKNQIQSGTFNYSKNKKLDKEISRRRSAETTRGDAINRSMGTSGSTEGAGGASGSSKTKPQTSAPAKDFTKKINQANKNRKEFTGNVDAKRFMKTYGKKGSVTNPEISGIDFDEPKRNVKDVSMSGTKSKGSSNVKVNTGPKVTKNYTRKNKGFTTPIKTKAPKPSFDISGAQYSKLKGPAELPTFVTSKGDASFSKTGAGKGAIKVQKGATRSDVNILRAGQKIARKSGRAKGLVKTGSKILSKLGPKGRLAAVALTGFAASPFGRKTIGTLATAGGLTALFGGGKKEKQLKVGDGLKNVGKVRVTADSRGLKRNQADMAKIKATQKNFIDKYNKGRTFGKIKYNVNKQGTYDVIKPKKK